MRTCDAKQAPCSSMNLIRGLSVSIRTAIGLHAGSAPVQQIAASSRPLGVLQHRTPLPAAAAACAAAQRMRISTTTAAAASSSNSSRQNDVQQDATAAQPAAEPEADGTPVSTSAAAATPDSADTAQVHSSSSSSRDESRDSRTVHEPVAAAGVVSEGSLHQSSSSSSSSSSSGSSRTAPGVARRPGPRYPPRPPVRHVPIPPSAAAVARVAQAAMPSDPSVSSGASSSTGWGDWGSSVGNVNGSSSSWGDTAAGASSSNPVSQHSNSGGAGSSGTSSTSSTTSSSSSGSAWWRYRHLDRVLKKKDFETLKQHGLTALEKWRSWGNPQLLQGWEQAKSALPAAVDRLHAVSRDEEGPLVTVFFDFETTGLSCCEPVELAAATPDRRVPDFQQLVSPLGKIHFKAYEAHGLKWSDLQRAPPTAVVLLAFVEWLTKVCTSTERGSCRLVLAGHNIDDFDLAQVLKPWLAVLGLSEQQQRLHWDSIDTKPLGYEYKAAYEGNDLPNCKLETLGPHFQHQAGSGAHLQAHRALGDVLTNQYVFRKLAEWKLGAKTDSLSLDELAGRLLSIKKPAAAATGAGKPAATGSSTTAAAKGKPAAAAAKDQPAAAASGKPASAQASQASVQQPVHTVVQQPASPTALQQQQQQQQEEVQHLQQSVSVSQQQQQQLWQPWRLQQQPRPAVLQPPLPPPPQLPQTSPTDSTLQQPQQRLQQQQQVDSYVASSAEAQKRQDSLRLSMSLLQEAEAAQDKESQWVFLRAALKLAEQNGFDLPGGVADDPQLLLEQLQAAGGSSSLAAKIGLGAASPGWSDHSPAASQLPSSMTSSSIEDSSSDVLLQHAALEASSSGRTGGGSSSSSSSSADRSNTQAAGSSGPPSRRSSGSSVGSSIGSSVLPSSSSWLEELPTTDVEAAVKHGLESLAGQDLRSWDQQQLHEAWPLMGKPLDPKDKLVSKRMYEKLSGAQAFDNYLKVLSYTPSIVQYHSSIPLDSSSSISEVDESPEDSADGAGDAADGIKHYVQLHARCLAASQPRSAMSGVIWSALLEVPTDPPSAGPVGLSVSFFTPGKWAMPYAQKEHKEALDAIKNGTSVLLRGRVKPLGKDKNGRDKKIPYWRPPSDLVPTWETCGTPAVSITWDPSAADAASDAAASADADAAATTVADVSRGTDSSSSGGGEVLEAQYKKIKDLTTADWLGSRRSIGIISPLLEAVRAQGALQDVLPEDVQQKYGLGGWLEDIEEVHRPTTEASYQRACKGIAMRELVLMQVAQFLERYRLTSDLAFQSLAGELLPPSRSDTEGDGLAQPQRRASTRPRKAAAAGSKGAGSGSAGSSDSGSSDTGSSSSLHSSSDSDEDVPLSQRQRQKQGLVDAFDLITPPHRVRSAKQVSAVPRGSAAYSVHNHEVIETAKGALGWDLTADQGRVLEEVMTDMRGPRAMLRLLQGDVGCGKTIIALLACLAAAAQGYQALLFAPTELLAGQHNKTLERLAEELPMAMRPRVGMLVGSNTAAAKKQLKKEIAAGDKNIIISTQAALWVNDWDKLALVVVDEQHKLGVKQREKLTRGLAAPPHMLLMTATPIPRTMAIMLYGGLALSTIRELPPGRTPVVTHVVPDEDSGRQEVYEVIKQEINSGGRAYIVCPLVNESDAFEGARTVEDEFARLSSSGIFGDSSKCGKLHGKMTGEEKAQTLERFKSGETPVLIASTVVEVGVDVPEASVMLVEAAHRFGLAQLHQLRGRVGRGSKASRCFLMAPAEDPKGTARLQVLEESNDGLAIAQADLDIRGPGDLWSGTKQSGKKSQLSKITMRQLEADDRIVEHARYIAAQLLLSISSNTAVKAALLASGFMELKEGEALPVARFGISGM